MKKVAVLLALGLMMVPLSAVIAFVLSPFWGWFEEKFGIEALGHSGPADWCFIVIYALLVLLARATGARQLVCFVSAKVARALTSRTRSLHFIPKLSVAIREPAASVTIGKVPQRKDVACIYSQSSRS